MAKQKFTVFLMPLEEGGYQVFFPYYPDRITYGDMPQDALCKAQEAIELYVRAIAEDGADPVPAYVYSDHAAVGQITAHVPDGIVEPAGEPQAASV